MDNILNIEGLPPEAKESIINFYEFIKLKYRDKGKVQSKSKKKLFALMKGGIHTLPEDFVFNREKLYENYPGGSACLKET